MRSRLGWDESSDSVSDIKRATRSLSADRNACFCRHAIPLSCPWFPSTCRRTLPVALSTTVDGRSSAFSQPHAGHRKVRVAKGKSGVSLSCSPSWNGALVVQPMWTGAAAATRHPDCQREKRSLGSIYLFQVLGFHSQAGFRATSNLCQTDLTEAGTLPRAATPKLLSKSCDPRTSQHTDCPRRSRTLAREPSLPTGLHFWPDPADDTRSGLRAAAACTSNENVGGARRACPADRAPTRPAHQHKHDVEDNSTGALFSPTNRNGCAHWRHCRQCAKT